MFQWKKVQLIFAAYCLLISAGAFVAALYLFLIPFESAQRWVLIGGMLFTGTFTLSLSIKAYRNHVWAEQAWFFLFKNERLSKIIRYGSLVGFIVSGFISLMPAYRLGNLQGYFVRLFPWIVWFVFVCLLTYLIARVEKYGLHWQRLTDGLHAQRKAWGIVLISMMVFCLIWIVTAWTGIGIRINDDYWYGAGVPILGLQVALAFSIGIGLLYLERSSLFNIRIPIRSDFLIFILLWGIAAFLWVREPLPSSYFATGPDLPAGEYYPFSDAATFDLGSQFALIGQGINNGMFFDRVLYMFFLLFLHVFVGQNYLQVVALQAAIFAVFPAILYLLGKAMHSRSFGVILAVLAILRGINGIASSSMIDLANQKQMLTDFPVVIFAAWFALMAVKWLQAPHKNYLYALWAGGAVGLAVMLRTHALFLLVFAILLAAIVYWNQKLRGLLISLLLVAAMFAVTLPWGVYSGGSVFDVYLVRIRNVIEQRYNIYPSTPTPEPQSNEPALFGAAIRNNEAAKVDLILNARNYLTIPAAESENEEVPVFVLVASHFLHNLIMSVLIMPASPVFHDLQHTLKAGAPFWQLYWDGSLGIGTGLFVMINLLLIALGIGVSWRFNRLAGLVPLGMFLFYNLANAFAQTSGGRYIVPVDWVVFFYFALGLFQLILWGLALFGRDDNLALEKTSQDLDDARRTPWIWKPLKQAPWVILFFLFIGASMPFSERLFPQQYPARSQAELFAIMEQEGYLQEAGLDRATVDALSAQWPAFRVTAGRILYPRYYTENRGEPKNRYPYGVLGFPRIAFTLIGPDGLNYVLLPGDLIPYFPNASDVIVLGCQESIYMDALVVVVIEEEQVVYVRQPESPLQCPLQQPVCDDNHVCR